MEIKEAFGADHPATDTNLDVCLRRMEHREAPEATLTNPQRRQRPRGPTNEPEHIYDTSSGLPTMPIEEAFDATTSNTKTDRDVCLRKMG